MPVNKKRKRASIPFSVAITEGHLLVNIDLDVPLRRALVILLALGGPPLAAEVIKALLNLR